MSAEPFKPFRHLNADFDPTSRKQVKELLNQLLSQIPTAPHSSRHWFELFSEASDALTDTQTQLEIATHIDTNDPNTSQRLQSFEEEVLSLLLSKRTELIHIYLSSPWKKAMHADDRDRLTKDFQNRLASSGPSLTELQLQENELVRKHKAFTHGLKTSFLGRVVPLSVVVGKLNERSEGVRKDAFLAYWKCVQQHSRSYAEHFSQLQEIRYRQSELAGHSNYEEFVTAELGRLDFGAAECAQLREHITREVVPIVKSLAQHQAKSLQSDTIRPWNARIWPEFYPQTLPANGDRSQFLKAMGAALEGVHPECGRLFQQLEESGSIDIFPRPGKAPGAFCALRPRSGLPFLFGNFSVAIRDTFTFFHEFGHCFHGYASSHIENPLLRNPGLEFCEFASTTFEFLAHRQLKCFWRDERDAEKARGFHLFHSLAFLPFAALIDAWQSKVYSTGKVLPERELCATWSQLSDAFQPQLDWSGYEEFQELGWCSRPHVFSTPFYYIDYAIAQVGAWQISQKKHASHLNGFLESLALGGQRSPFELFEVAGCESPFAEETVIAVGEIIRKEMTALLRGVGIQWPQ